jgi:hypothetical protein
MPAPQDTWSSWRRSILAATQPAATPVPLQVPIDRPPALEVAEDRLRLPSTDNQRLDPGTKKEIVTELLRQNPRLRASEVRAALAGRGDIVSLRTAQRLCAEVIREGEARPVT